MVVEPRTRQHQPQVVALPRRYTVADYDLLPEDGPRHELIDGVLTEMPSPTTLHQWISGLLFNAMFAVVMRDRLGRLFADPLDVELSDGVVVQPDILFVSSARAEVIRDARIVGAPDLVVEISSPTTRDRDLIGKRNAYRETGVREYWFVDIDERTLTVWVAGDGDWDALGADEQGYARSTVLPGLTVDPVALFAE